MYEKLYKPFKSFVFRCPSLPLPQNGSTLQFLALEDLLQSDFRDAIYTASPDFFEVISAVSTDQKKSRKIQNTLLKYYLRSVYRSTPFGLFAGAGVGTISNDNSGIEMLPTSFVRHSRLDMDYLSKLSIELCNSTRMRQYLRYSPNNSIYQVGEKLRYIEYKLNNGVRAHELNSVNRSLYLDKLLERASLKATISELINEIDDVEIDENEKIEYVNELIQAQLLVSELDLSTVGVPMELQLLETLNRVLPRIRVKEDRQFLCSIIQSIEKILSILKQADQNGISKQNTDLYTEIEAIVTSIAIPHSKQFLIQTDLQVIPRCANLNYEVVDDTLQAIDVLSRFTTADQFVNLSVFKAKFIDRWGEEEIPLTIALDHDIGIGYPVDNSIRTDISTILSDINVAEIGGEGMQNQPSSPFTEFWANKYVNAIKNGAKEIILSEAEVAAFQSRMKEMPATFFAMISVHETGSRHHGVAKPFVQLKIVGGSTSANLISRFSHNDQNMLSILKEIVAYERQAHKDVILAEMVHLPESRTGNILTRPKIYDYEIPFLSKSELAPEFQIPVSDLVISIRNDKVKLRSKSLNREILPRLTSAHSFQHNSLPAYHFLCDLQTKGAIPWLKLDTGDLEKCYKYIPRISFQEKIILQPETWNLLRVDYQHLFNTEDEDILYELFVSFKTFWGMPELIALQEGDNELVINTSERSSVLLFLYEIRNKDRIKLVEFLFHSEGQGLVRSGEKSHTNELILFFKRMNYFKATQDKIISDLDEVNLTRDFYPGDELVTFKIYTGYKAADEILVDVFQHIVHPYLREGIVNKWFFVRYYDSGFHLRLRLLLNDKASFAKVVGDINLILRDYIQTRVIWKVVIGTYKREMERYGSKHMEDSESIFSNDSGAIATLLGDIEGSEGELLRWFCGIRIIEAYFTAFRLNMNEKHAFAIRARDSFMLEFAASNKFTKQLDKKYREYRLDIDQLLDVDHSSILMRYPSCVRMLATLSHFDHQLSLLLKNRLAVQGLINISSNLVSYVHMSINRLFRSQNRLHEFVLYWMIEKHYNSKLAKLKASNVVS